MSPMRKSHHALGIIFVAESSRLSGFQPAPGRALRRWRAEHPPPRRNAAVRACATTGTEHLYGVSPFELAAAHG